MVDREAVVPPVIVICMKSTLHLPQRTSLNPKPSTPRHTHLLASVLDGEALAPPLIVIRIQHLAPANLPHHTPFNLHPSTPRHTHLLDSVLDGEAVAPPLIVICTQHFAQQPMLTAAAPLLRHTPHTVGLGWMRRGCVEGGRGAVAGACAWQTTRGSKGAVMSGMAIGEARWKKLWTMPAPVQVTAKEAALVSACYVWRSGGRCARCCGPVQGSSGFGVKGCWWLHGHGQPPPLALLCHT